MKEKILSIIIMAFLLITIGITSADAASCGITVTPSKGTVEVGEPVTVRVSFSPTAYSASFYLNYDSSILQYESASAGMINRSGNQIEVNYIKYDDSFNLIPISSFTFTFTAKAKGTVNCSVSGATLSGENPDDGAYTISSNRGASIIVNEKAVTPPPEEKPDPKPENPTPSNPEPSNPTPSNPEPTNPTPSNPEPTNPTPTEPTFRNDNSTVYATNNVNIRSSWTTAENNILGMLKRGEEITRTGINSEWDRVTYNGRTAYIRHGYLTTEKPDENSEDNNGENENIVDENQVGVVDPIEQEPNTTENNTTKENDVLANNPVENKDKKNGKIIAIACSIIAIVVAGIIIFIIYKKTNDDEEEEEEESNTKSNSRNNTIKNTTNRTTGTRKTTTRTSTTNRNNKTTSGKKE